MKAQHKGAYNARIEFWDVDQIPSVLTRPPEGVTVGAAVIVVHGFQQQKESRLPEMLALSDAGLLAVAPDAPAHGARWDMDRLLAAYRDYRNTLTPLIIETGQELVQVAEWLQAEFGILHQQVGLYGSSMGGGAVLVATPLLHPQATVALKADGNLSHGWELRQQRGHPASLPIDQPYDPEVAALVRQFDPLLRASEFPPTATLLIAAEQDPLVPLESVQELHGALLPAYAAFPQRLQMVTYPGDHSTPPDMKARSRAWLLEHLAGE